jgi:hypothetical protein
VTGTGVVPIGGACQAQAAALAGGGAGAVVKDGVGTVMGTSLDGGSFLTQVGPDLVRLPVDPSGYIYQVYFWWGGTSCTGQPYFYSTTSALYKTGLPFDATQYFVFPTSGQSNLPYGSTFDANSLYNSQTDCDTYYGAGNATFIAPHGCCCDTICTGTNYMTSVTVGTLPTFTPPLSLVLP